MDPFSVCLANGGSSFVPSGQEDGIWLDRFSRLLRRLKRGPISGIFAATPPMWTSTIFHTATSTLVHVRSLTSSRALSTIWKIRERQAPRRISSSIGKCQVSFGSNRLQAAEQEDERQLYLSSHCCMKFLDDREGHDIDHQISQKQG